MVNRAYYAMFYAVLGLLQQSGTVPRKHTGVLALFDSEYVRTGRFDKRYSKYFHHAFNLRQVSDYHTIEPVDENQADELIKNAAEFIQAIQDAL